MDRYFSNIYNFRIHLNYGSFDYCMILLRYFYLDPANKPVRACVEAPMAHPNILFEAMIVATK